MCFAGNSSSVPRIASSYPPKGCDSRYGLISFNTNLGKITIKVSFFAPLSLSILPFCLSRRLVNKNLNDQRKLQLLGDHGYYIKHLSIINSLFIWNEAWMIVPYCSMSLGKVKAITYPTTILKLAFWREHCHLYSSLTLSTTTTLLLRNQSLAVPGQCFFVFIFPVYFYACLYVCFFVCLPACLLFSKGPKLLAFQDWDGCRSIPNPDYKSESACALVD